MLLRCVEPPMSQMGHSHRFPDVRVTSACAPRPAAKRTSQDFALVQMSEVRMIYIPAAVDPGDYPYERLAAVGVPS